ncbi:cytochrome P450 [Basidiobolus meristosporus CBS 931.73]|uniref:Cytochrome P450 n=1 Tax=Basidiobolus meristosporus CBS 931.73 TaxID=1314790 RepID=A0A1Y1YHC7_9FUNG|nr:cytochrome P450 [Basidiobolus meristosporus CBS 931.73]|eukprot:ORX97407.1 cytochrome P450 [Basidiobolus meristosporus CBS 931.73]
MSSECPFKKGSANKASTTVEKHKGGEGSGVIIVAFSGQDIEKNGIIVRTQDNWDIEDVRKHCGEKLNISAYQTIEFYNDGGQRIDSFRDLIESGVAYIQGNESCHLEIPAPPTSIFFGTLPKLLPDMPASLRRYFAEYDSPVLEIYIFSTREIVTNHPSIAEVIAQESEYFTKRIELPFAEVKVLGGDGLFTTSSDEEVWKLAHKLLIPAFSSTAMKSYTEEMGHLALKLANVFGQFKPDEPILVTDWMTRITFETIGMVGFGYDFGLLESRDSPSHPFIEAMSFCMTEVRTRMNRSQYWKKLPIHSNYKFDKNIDLMRNVVEEVLNQRKKTPSSNGKTSDLLGFMLEARDKSTGEKLSDSVIRDQVLTFLIAGHETTSTTLSWCLYLLARHPAVLNKVLQEVVNAGFNGEKPPTSAQVSQLKYLGQVLKEALRMYPPASSVLKYCTKDCILPFGYKIEKNTAAQISIYSMHHNPSFWPEPDVFDPDRFTPAEEAKRPQYAWMPFSSGPRGCIGMQFAITGGKNHFGNYPKQIRVPTGG